MSNLSLDKVHRKPLTAKQLGMLLHVMKSNLAYLAFAKPHVQLLLKQDIMEIKLDLEFILNEIEEY